MNITIHKNENSLVGIVVSEKIIINDAQSALELIMNLQYNTGANKIILYKKNICDDFFILRTKVAGEVLQKYITYKTKLAIVGDFGKVEGALHDFIYECNSGKDIFFMPTLETSLEKLHSV